MRVSDSMQFDSMSRSMSMAEQRLQEASKVASSGARVGAPSDDPVAAAQAARVQASIGQVGAYRTTIQMVRSDADLAETTLAQSKSLIDQAHDLALQGANGGLDPSSRNAMAIQVGQLKAQLVGLANTKGSQGYLFSGTKTDTVPFTNTGSFQGNDGDRNVSIGTNVVMAYNTSGAKAFTSAGGRDVFADLDALQTALAANDQSGVAATVNNLDAVGSQLLAARVDAGVKLGRLDTSDATHQQTTLTLATERSHLVDADPIVAYTNLAQTQQTLQSAIAVSQTLLKTLSTARI
jgi:flagellar hook-associated protein 3 FlgL